MKKNRIEKTFGGQEFQYKMLNKIGGQKGRSFSRLV